ncbi:hypothetical protein BH23GEM9_BH23GEM9_06990 [soil metagenome]
MKVLVTGGTGVIGRAAITELLSRGHTVRLLSRGADDDSASRDERVEPFSGDVGDANSVHGAATGCGAVVHIAGVVEESPPDVTFERINVEGTRNMVAEAARADVARFIFISSIGAQRGQSNYHRSKLEGERIARQFVRDWIVLRTGAVAGPGDETVSVLLRMVRILPAVPIIEGGDQPFQPIWHEDVAWAIAECLERDDVVGRVLRIAGDEVITVNDLLDMFSSITDRSPLRVPLPALLARLGTSLAAAVGLDTPVSAATVQMLIEGNTVTDGEDNDLTGLLGFEPRPFQSRLVQLADDAPEQTPDEGVGKLQRRRFRIDIAGGRYDAAGLAAELREHFAEMVPFEAAAEPGAPESIRDHDTLTLELPARGHVQVRVEESTERSLTLATLEGHPLAGVVRFSFSDVAPTTVRFTIDVIERPASRLDQISMALGGSAAQKRSWTSTAERICAHAGGTSADGVMEDSWSLDDDEAEPLEDWVRDLIQKRDDHT